MTDLKEDSNVDIVETLLMRKDSYLAREADMVVVWAALEGSSSGERQTRL